MNPSREESTKDEDESDRGEYVAQEKLGSDSPVEETNVGRVSGVPVEVRADTLNKDSRIDSVGDQGMVVVLDAFDDVGERLVGVDHGQRANRLRSDKDSGHCHRSEKLSGEARCGHTDR